MEAPRMHDRMTRSEVIMYIALGAFALVVALAIWWAVKAKGSAPPPIERQGARHGPAVLFIGSSTIARFPLKDAFPDSSWQNLGKPDESAVLLRERIAKTE